MRILLLIVILIGIGACSSTRSGMDHTSNQSRSRPASKKSTRVAHKPESYTGGESRESLVSFAESLIGSRYKYGGNSPKQGFDCSGFTCYVMRNEDITLPRTSTDQSRLGKRKDISRAQTGDLIFFGHGKRVTHVGIVVMRGRDRIDVIHSTSSRGVVRDNILGSDYWRSRTLWAVDFTELD